jgi:hypothetical protein
MCEVDPVGAQMHGKVPQCSFTGKPESVKKMEGKSVPGILQDIEFALIFRSSVF